MDVLFINPSTGSNYQSLKNDYAAIEPPTWALLLAQSMRSFGYTVSLIDANAENLKDNEVYKKVLILNPRLIVFVVYGQNVNAGTTNMESAVKLSSFLKSKNKNFIISYVGSYVQALPVKVLQDENSIDIILYKNFIDFDILMSRVHPLLKT